MISNDLSYNHAALSARLLALCPTVLMCLMGVTHIHAASIYKTYDAAGNVVFTDQPADEASAELLATPAVNVADPLPVAPQTPPQLPATGTPMAGGTTPAALDAYVAVPNAATQAGNPTGTALTAPVTQAVQQIPVGTTAVANSETRAVQPVIPTATVATSGERSVATPGADMGAMSRTSNTPELADQEPLSERVATPVLPEGARPPVIGAVKPSTKTQIRINWPAPDEVVLSTQSPIWIELDSQPTSLKALGLQAEVWIDDKLAVSGERPLLPLVLPEIGMHKLQVRLIDSKGKSVAESDSQLMDVRLGASQTR